MSGFILICLERIVLVFQVYERSYIVLASREVMNVSCNEGFYFLAFCLLFYLLPGNDAGMLLEWWNGTGNYLIPLTLWSSWYFNN